MALRVIRILAGTTVDGPGLRTSIYFAGCTHACKGCHNRQTWDFGGGVSMTVDEIMEEVERNGFNVTLTGGDPLQQNPNELYKLLVALREHGYNVWCYTGYTYEEVVANTTLQPLLNHISVLVDGPFIERLRDTTLLFRGSSNQRLIRIAESHPGRIKEWQDTF